MVKDFFILFHENLSYYLVIAWRKKTETTEEKDQEKDFLCSGYPERAALLMDPEGIVSVSPIPCEGSKLEK